MYNILNIYKFDSIESFHYCFVDINNLDWNSIAFLLFSAEAHISEPENWTYLLLYKVKIVIVKKIFYLAISQRATSKPMEPKMEKITISLMFSDYYNLCYVATSEKKCFAMLCVWTCCWSHDVVLSSHTLHAAI